MSTAKMAPNRLLSLPRKLRDAIWKLSLASSEPIALHSCFQSPGSAHSKEEHPGKHKTKDTPSTALLQTCRAINTEATPILYRNVVCVRTTDEGIEQSVDALRQMRDKAVLLRRMDVFVMDESCREYRSIGASIAPILHLATGLVRLVVDCDWRHAVKFEWMEPVVIHCYAHLPNLYRGEYIGGYEMCLSKLEVVIRHMYIEEREGPIDEDVVRRCRETHTLETKRNLKRTLADYRHRLRNGLKQEVEVRTVNDEEEQTSLVTAVSCT
ncbi:hypothetical protein EJ05DRAFT_254947 [Pseudovirgaria hyperparasitica]|uniref:Uncharacterized protein n=1 Tax=Pseudovirgaria hyperparasitica TaxID=470096 RepID=A0A6A6WGJ3_9PEZI|nr:uncharacterized protein EJ05DRAFT_254947 [Pseudovirgaria hyperparasitica]KAF2761170.1 hypothetical protein EJ05DRAFT_254947 [Pseudovirgaria hyperparasitica]